MIDLKICSIPTCGLIEVARGWCNKHWKKWRVYGDPLAGYEEASRKGEGSRKPGRYDRRIANGKEKLRHIMLAEEAIGHALPLGAQVHHWDKDRHNNDPSNLVVCPDRAYHALLHNRQEALDGCGDANKRQCSICKQWDDPQNVTVERKAQIYWAHKECYRIRNNQTRRQTYARNHNHIGVSA